MGSSSLEYSTEIDCSLLAATVVLSQLQGLPRMAVLKHKQVKQMEIFEKYVIRFLRPNNDVSQTSRRNIKGVSVSEVMRIENMITQVQFY